MRKLLLSSAALAAMSVAALGADLPARGAAVAPAPIYAAPMFTWSGFYVGLNAGVGFRGNNNRADYVYSASGANDDLAADINDDLLLAGRRSGDRSGFTGGAQIGYNWQFGALVVGIEADINAMSRGGRNNSYTAFDLADTGYDLTVRGGGRGSNWFGTLRPRVGFAMDRTLLYVTGGLAYSGGGGNGGGYAVVTDPADNDNIVAEYTSTHRSRSNWGWTLGAGVEHAFSNNWTAKLEYLYVDLNRGSGGNYTTTTGGTFGDIVGRRGVEENGFHVVRVGLNYKFGGSSAGPVLARY